MKNEHGDSPGVTKYRAAEPLQHPGKERYGLALGIPSQPKATVRSLVSLLGLKILNTSFFLPVDGNQPKLN